MAPPPEKKKGKKKGQILGLPWQVVAGGVVLAVAIGLYLRHRASTSGAAGTSATPAQDTTGAGSGSGGGSSPTDSGTQPGVDLTGIEDQLAYLTSLLGSGSLDTGALATDNGSSSGQAAATGPTNDQNGQYFFDPSGNLQPAGQAPNSFILAPGIYSDVTSPGYVSAQQALTSFWGGLGSPTQVKSSLLHPSKSAVVFPQKPVQHAPAPHITAASHGFAPTPVPGVHFTQQATTAFRTPGGAVATQAARAPGPPKKGLQSGRLF